MSTPSTQPALQISDLRKDYGRLTALDGIDLVLQAGEFFGLLGPNGAGKTTSINVVAGLCVKTQGSVHVFGHELHRHYRACRRLIGLVPQEFNFDQFTQVKKILMFQGGYFGIPRGECERRADQLLEEFDLRDKAEVPARMLSGGMKRRLIIARALVHQPRLLILDEPTAGVDVDLRRALWKLVRRLNREGTTVLLTTHYIEEAEALCDRIAILHHGRIIANDATSALVNRLTRESLNVSFDAPLPGDAAARLQAFAPQVAPDARSLTLTYDRSQTTYEHLLQGLLDAGPPITAIRPVENRLEQVFLQLTRGEEPPHG